MNHEQNKRLIDELNKITDMNLDVVMAKRLSRLEGDVLFTQQAKESVKSDLTLDDLRKTLDTLPPRMLAEGKLLNALRGFPDNAVYHLSGLIERGMLDFMKEEKDG